MDETEGVPVTSSGAGLRPPAPSSVDPMGIPTRPTGAPADIPVGDDAEAVGEARLGPAVQVPDAVPVVPPSNTVANPVGEAGRAHGGSRSGRRRAERGLRDRAAEA